MLQAAVIPELLAPAGNLETALAAFDAGADAVYCGLARFSARERAENFTPTELARLCAFAHEHGKKVHLAVNTLVFEPELSAVAETLAEAVRCDVDAVIVQDVGVIALARRFFPTLKLHASTQMGIHNSAGVAAGAALGVSRIILERQVTLSELEKIVPASPVEIEVFLHGSLCCSLSGRCLLSPATGGGSGNRGGCRQPCRKRYNGKYLLSPADLQGVDLLPELRKIGVASLKIEGRLRPPEYVWKSSRAYRMLLDSPDDPDVRIEAIRLLDSAAGRGKSRGFFFSKEFPRLIDPEKSGVFGLPVGRIERVGRQGIAVRTTGRIHLGDRLRPIPPDGGDPESFSVISLETEGKSVPVVRPGTLCVLPNNFRCAPGWTLCKVGENGFDFSRRAAALPDPRIGIRLQVEASATLWRVTAGEFPDWSWERECEFPAARKCCASEEAVREAFAAGAPAPWRAASVAVRLDGEFFLPAAELKAMRRSFWEKAEKEFNRFLLPDRSAEGLAAFQKFYALPPARAALPFPEKVFRLPAFLSETLYPEYVERFRQAYREGCRFIQSGGIHALTLAAGFPDAEVVAAFPLMVCNSPGAALLKEHKVAAAFASPELTPESFEALEKRSPIPVRPAERKLPLLVTRLPLPSGEWHDGAGRWFRCDFDPEEKLSRLFLRGEDGKRPDAPNPAGRSRSGSGPVFAESPLENKTEG